MFHLRLILARWQKSGEPEFNQKSQSTVPVREKKETLVEKIVAAPRPQAIQLGSTLQEWPDPGRPCKRKQDHAFSLSCARCEHGSLHVAQVYARLPAPPPARPGAQSSIASTAVNRRSTWPTLLPTLRIHELTPINLPLTIVSQQTAQRAATSNILSFCVLVSLVGSTHTNLLPSFRWRQL